jgi:hypothetical protein
MKHMTKLNLLLSVCLLPFSTVFASPEGDHGAGNGGNANEIEFKHIMKRVTEFAYDSPEIFPELVVHREALRTAHTRIELQMTTDPEVIARHPLLKDRACINVIKEGFSNWWGTLSKIICKSDEWSALGQNVQSKHALVFHEVLGVLGIEMTGNYSLSNRILSRYPSLEEHWTVDPVMLAHEKEIFDGMASNPNVLSHTVKRYFFVKLTLESFQKNKTPTNRSHAIRINSVQNYGDGFVCFQQTKNIQTCYAALQPHILLDHVAFAVMSGFDTDRVQAEVYYMKSDEGIFRKLRNTEGDTLFSTVRKRGKRGSYLYVKDLQLPKFYY